MIMIVLLEPSTNGVADNHADAKYDRSYPRHWLKPASDEPLGEQDLATDRTGQPVGGESRRRVASRVFKVEDRLPHGADGGGCS